MNNLDNLKSEYEKIEASDNLRNRVNNTLKKEMKKKSIFINSLGLVASFIFVFFLAVNFIPNLAYAMSDIPVVGQVVKIITFGRYEKSENGYNAKIITPKIEGLLDKNLENKLNEQFKENANFIIWSFEQDVKKLKEKFGDKSVHMGVEFNYIIKTDNENIVALDVYVLNIAGSSSTKHTFYNLNKKTGQLLTLKGLFKDNADYISVLSSYIKDEMLRRNKEESGMFWVDGDSKSLNGVGFKNIKADQNFYINNAGNIVICFDKYEVSAGAQGSPEFIIPNDLVKSLLK